MPFLLATFLVYAILPDRNLHGKALMCYVMSLLLAYIFLVSIILQASALAKVPCLTLGNYFISCVNVSRVIKGFIAFLLY